MSQTDLANESGVSRVMIGKYECGEACPSIEVAITLAENLSVSVDYLIGKSDLMIDPSILDKITTIQKLPDQDREHILFALDAMLRDAKARAAYQ